jgi:DNA-binding HxlR family transcriptional regulator
MGGIKSYTDMPRQYNQFCALARALDVVGERWTLLVVRELLLGPRRFNQLADALPGIGRNLLAARLRELRDAGLIEHRGRAYRLTARGRGLEEAVLALTRWEMDAMRPPTPGDRRRAGWYALAMRAAFRPDAARDVDETYEFRVGGETFHLRACAGRAEAAHGSAERPAAVLEADLDSFLGIATGLDDLGAAIGAGRARVEGSRAALRRGLRIFGLPAPRAA